MTRTMKPPRILMCPECGMRITVRLIYEATCCCLAAGDPDGDVTPMIDVTPQSGIFLEVEVQQ